MASACAPAGSVYDFHQRFGVEQIDLDTDFAGTLAVLRSRLGFLAEELGEHAKGLNTGDARAAAEEMADVAFVALGTLLVLDAAGREACTAVAGKNDRKTGETHALDASSGKLVRRRAGV